MYIGIEAIAFYTPPYYLPLSTLAQATGVDVNKYHTGLGQFQMSLLPPNQDAVTLGANAAKKLINSITTEGIDMLLFATESSFEASKSLATYLHRLLELAPNCRAVELKQACYGGTAALMLAKNYVTCNPQSKVLIVCADVAHYPLNSPGEPTQGCGAVAMLVSNNPKVAQFTNKTSSFVTKDTMDFWRPNYLKHPLVDGQLSTKTYLDLFATTWQQYHALNAPTNKLNFICFHLPFTKIATKALSQVIENQYVSLSEAVADLVEPTLVMAKKVGNCYTASLYLSLYSLLCNVTNPKGKETGMFSYGSGATAEFFTLLINCDQLVDNELDNRIEVDYKQYVHWHNYTQPTNNDLNNVPQVLNANATFVLTAINNNKRIYNQVIHD